MFLATLFISGRDWLLPAAGALGVALLALAWGYYGAPAGRGTRALCLSLKLLGLLALAFCLLEPLWSGQRARPGANLFVVLADNSQGMQIKDRGEPRSRGEFLRGLLAADGAAWQDPLNESFQVRRYLFDSRLQSTRDFSELLFDGPATSLGAALRTLGDRYHGQPLAGVLLFTDGNATDLGDGPPDLAGLPPIYPVVIGRDDPIKDVALQKVAVSQTSFEDAPVTIQADVTAAGYAGANIVAQLLPAGPAPASTNETKHAPGKAMATAPAAQEKIVAEQIQKAPRAGEKLTFRFQIRPEQSGLSFYRLRVSAQSELGQFARPEISTEATLANNSRVLVVDRGRGPYRILYVSGRPNWEYKFLQRAITEDEQVQLVGLIRIARREPKFEFKGRIGESSNPLYRGFGNQSKEEVERYDQPVLVRLNTRDEFELRGGFPKTAEELYAYHAVVLDDLEAEFFTQDQMRLLQKFVSERGGGFLMLGGAESFHQGHYDRTPIGDMLPVYLDRTEEGKPLAGLRLTLTREGWLQPWARLRNNENDERTRLAAMPPFEVMNRTREIKPGASAIATVTDARGATLPALVVQRFGHGRTAALMIGDLWRWGLHDEESHRDMDKAWRQLMRWLISDVPERFDLQTETKRGDANQAVALQVRARDKVFQPLDNATVNLTVQPFADAPRTAKPAEAGSEPRTGTNSVRLAAEASLSEAGLYEAMYVPRQTGGYRAEAVVTDASGEEVGRAQAGWTSDPAAEEFRSLTPNRALLETIAKRTGGELIDANQLAAFARSLPNRKVPITESWTSPLWHQPAVFLFALACFLGEWGLRRWKGMA